MITNALLYVLTGVMNAIYALLPNWTVDLGTTMGTSGAEIPLNGSEATAGQSSLRTLLIYIHHYDSFLPLSDIWAAANLVFLVYLAMTAFKGLKWIAGMIRGAGT